MQKKMILISLAVVLALGIGVFFSRKNRTTEALQLERLENTDFPAASGMSVLDADGETIVAADLSDHSPAIVRFGGERKELKRISPPPKKADLKEGVHFSRLYASGDTRLTLDFVTTLVCDELDDSCEDNEFKVDVTFQDGSRLVKLGPFDATEGT